MHPDLGARLRKSRRIGHGAAAFHETPAAHQWRDRDIECAAGFLRIDAALVCSKRKRLGSTRTGSLGRAGVQIRDFAGRVDRDLTAHPNPLDFTQRFLTSGSQVDKGFSPCSTNSKRVAMALQARVTRGMRPWPGDRRMAGKTEWRRLIPNNERMTNYQAVNHVERAKLGTRSTK